MLRGRLGAAARCQGFLMWHSHVFRFSDPSRRLAGWIAHTPRRAIVALLVLLAFGPLIETAGGQNAPPVPKLERRPSTQTQKPASHPSVVALRIPKGTPIEISVERDTRIHKAGQEIRGHVVEPVYAFDKLVIPAGSEAIGRISAIGSVPAGKRTLAALDADFTPSRKVTVQFNEIVLPNGKRIPISGDTAPGSGQVMQFVSADHAKAGRRAKIGQKAAAEEKQGQQELHAAMEKIRNPGKIHRLLRYALAELPVRPRYINAGTVYFVELREALDFGSEPSDSGAEHFIGKIPPGSVVHALLITPLDSASTKKDAQVEAVLSQPLFDGEHHLILPEGSRLQGVVLQVHPARTLHRNGQMRLVFRRLIPPRGARHDVDANLNAVQANRQDRVRLDSEGGAKSTDSKTRYFSSGVSMLLAAASFQSDPDAVGGDSGNSLNRAAGGVNGFRLVGIALGLAVHSQPFGMAMGAYGGGMSVYSNFIKKGREVVFPKDTAMTIEIGTRSAPTPATPLKDRASTAGAQ